VIENGVLTLQRFKIQLFYDGFRKSVERLISPRPFDDSSTMPVPEKSNQILSALQMIRDERDDPMYDATVDEVLDMILNIAIEAYGSSARDVYLAIDNPTIAESSINNALEGMKYDGFHSAVVCRQCVNGDR
jgi:hypothetical protein